MSLVPRCWWCPTTDGPLTEVVAVESGSGPGWFYSACQRCLVRQRLIPIAAHPDTSYGQAHRYPSCVPDALVARLAEVPDPGKLREAVNALFEAERAIAAREVQEAVGRLTTLGRGGLRAVPEGSER